MFVTIFHENAVLLLLWVTKRSGGVYPKGTLRRGQSHHKSQTKKNCHISFLFYSTFSRLRGADFVKRTKKCKFLALYNM